MLVQLQHAALIYGTNATEDRQLGDHGTGKLTLAPDEYVRVARQGSRLNRSRVGARNRLKDALDRAIRGGRWFHILCCRSATGRRRWS